MSAHLSNHDLAYQVEYDEAEAYADLFSFAPANLSLQVQRIGGSVLLLAEHFDTLLFNRVIGLGLSEPATEALLDQIVATYQQAGLHNFGVQLSPASLPATLPTWLAERNFVLRDRWAKVYRQPSSTISIPTTLRTECIDPDAAPTPKLRLPASASRRVNEGASTWIPCAKPYIPVSWSNLCSVVGAQRYCCRSSGGVP
jgi:hypothetical protein